MSTISELDSWTKNDLSDKLTFFKNVLFIALKAYK